jgi:molybdate transport system substrate-binding protein
LRRGLPPLALRARRLSRGGLGLLLLLAAASEPAARDRSRSREITVYAAASLSDAFRELAPLFEREPHGARVRYNFAGSQQLAVQLEQGARADVFASADQRWMDYLAERELTSGTASIFARNRLVAIVPRANPGRITALADLARPGLKLVVAADAVPAGRYTREVIRGLSERPGAPQGYGERVLANVVSREENVKSVLAKVQLGEADAGFVYRSDVTGAVAPSLTVLDIPDDANVVARYPIAVVAGARDSTAARAFVSFVLGTRAQQVLARHGLVPAQPTP